MALLALVALAAQPVPAQPAPEASAPAPAPVVSAAERYELAVEVVEPIPLAEAPLAAAVPEAGPLRVRLDVYDDTGALVRSFRLAPSIASPDWTADFDPETVRFPKESGSGAGSAADWSVDWGDLGTDFLTLAFVRDVPDPGDDEVLARYVYVPTALTYADTPTDTDFYHPADETGPADTRFEVYLDANDDAAVRAKPGFAHAFYEDALDGPYVIPYDHGVGCGAACPAGAPGFFLARLPEGAAPPTAATQRYAFADAAPPVLVAHDWGTSGVLTWDVPGLVLAFPEGRRLEVEGALEATGVTLTEAVEDAGWGGVAFLQPNGGGATTASGLHGVTVEKVRVAPSGGLPVPHGAVAVAGRVLVVDDESEIQGGVGVAGLLATGADADVTVTGESAITGNDGGGVWATGGAQVAISGLSRVELNLGGAGVRADGYGTLVELDGAFVLDNTGIGVRALSQGEVAFASDEEDSETHVERNQGGLDAGSGGSLDAGQCANSDVSAPCDGRVEHSLLDNDQSGAYFDARSLGGAVLYAEGNAWDETDYDDLVLDYDAGSVLDVCPMIGDACTAPAPRIGGGEPFDSAHGERRTGGGGLGVARHAGDARRSGASRSTESGEPGRELSREGGSEPPLRLSDVLALVDEAERARLAGDADAFAIAASAAVAALDTSATDEDRRAAFEVTARLFAWAQPAQPLADLEALATETGEGRPWALRALGVARASAGGAEGYADAEAVADTLASAYAGSEHARFGYALAVRVAVAEDDEGGAVSSLLALASAFPEAEELGPLAAVVAGAFPDADLSGMEGRHAGEGGAPFAAASATASGALQALLTVGAARPNPSPSSALIPFELAGEARVEAVLYDVLGRRLAVLASGAFPAGRHTLAIDGAPASRLPSGTYVVYVTARRGGEPAARAVRRLTITR